MYFRMILGMFDWNSETLWLPRLVISERFHSNEYESNSWSQHEYFELFILLCQVFTMTNCYGQIRISHKAVLLIQIHYSFWLSFNWIVPLASNFFFFWCHRYFKLQLQTILNLMKIENILDFSRIAEEFWSQNYLWQVCFQRFKLLKLVPSYTNFSSLKENLKLDDYIHDSDKDR